jgi:hypothetical protein
MAAPDFGQLARESKLAARALARTGRVPDREAADYGPETGMRMTTRSSVPTVLVM